MPDFQNSPPPELRKFARAFFEMKFNPLGGYVRNFDVICTVASKLAFLHRRGRIAPGEELTDEQVESRYDACRRKILTTMQADEGMIY
jgi:hypothetical protein